MKPLQRCRFSAAALARDFPTAWEDRNKRLVFDTVNTVNPEFAGVLDYARWPAAELPRHTGGESDFHVRDGVFTYPRGAEGESNHWHMNFADSRLFVAYRSALMAQDELQVAEHPILGSLRDALVAAGSHPLTIDPGGSPTPITICGAERRCSIDTLARPEVGRPRSLYGNAFARASADEVIAATVPIVPPTVSRILAIAAPHGGFGPYRGEQIDYVVSAAYTGFTAARLETERLEGRSSRVVIHTGFWGCGAFGGNRTLMTALQALAGALAGVDIVFHALDAAGIATATQAVSLFRRIIAETTTVPAAVERFERQGFRWGVSDGN